MLVNGVAPGPILPHSAQTPLSFQQAQERCPLQYNPSPSDVADALVFLVKARSVTGQTIYVDAGDRYCSRLKDNPS